MRLERGISLVLCASLWLCSLGERNADNLPRGWKPRRKALKYRLVASNFHRKTTATVASSGSDTNKSNSASTTHQSNRSKYVPKPRSMAPTITPPPSTPYPKYQPTLKPTVVSRFMPTQRPSFDNDNQFANPEDSHPITPPPMKTMPNPTISTTMSPNPPFVVPAEPIAIPSSMTSSSQAPSCLECDDVEIGSPQQVRRSNQPNGEIAFLNNNNANPMTSEKLFAIQEEQKQSQSPRSFKINLSWMFVVTSVAIFAAHSWI